jgi:3-deoxy-D-manno-octulosonic-acid transferase
MRPARVPLGYRLLLALSAPLLLGYTLLRARRDGGKRYLLQRLGFAFPQLDRPIWLHCASVGEVIAALPLIDALRERQPNTPLLVTTNTPTGADVLLKKRGEQVTHAYLPLDFRFAVARFFRRCQPRSSLILETELWPNLYRAAAARGTPVRLVNARLSQKTLGANALLKAAYRSCLANAAQVLARGKADADGFRQLGASAEKVQVIGNIKFAATGGSTAEMPRLIERRYWLAASTHDDEELQLARMWQELAPRDELLVIAPRHPERRDAILRQLEPLGLRVTVRSRDETIAADTQLYLADTLGELGKFIAHAELVFMGGSLIERGGQNLLEPARAGKAILCGPDMSNFAAELALFREADAVVQLAANEELAETVAGLLDSAARRQQLGDNAAAVMLREQNVIDRYLEQLADALSEAPR